MEGTEKAKVLIGLSFTLLGYIFLAGGVGWILTSIIAGFAALLAFMLLFKDKFPPRLERHLTDISRGLDVGWLALGLGLFGMGIKCLQIQDQIRSVPLVWLGVIFMLLSALLIGVTIGMGANEILKRSPKGLIVFGAIFLVGGAVWLVISWGSLNTNTLMGNLNAFVSQLFIACLGIVLVSYGWRRSKNRVSQIRTQANDQS
jgi:hypothetical protein